MFVYQQSDFEMQPWTLVNPQNLCVRRKIEKAGASLEDLHTKIRLGLATGDNNAFIVNETQRQNFLLQDIKNEEIIKPVVRGQDIKRYYHSAPQYLLLTKNNIDVSCSKSLPLCTKKNSLFRFLNRGFNLKRFSLKLIHPEDIPSLFFKVSLLSSLNIKSLSLSTPIKTLYLKIGSLAHNTHNAHNAH